MSRSERGVAVRYGLLLALALAGCAGGPGRAGGDPNAEIYDAWQNSRSRIEVTANGSVVRVLGMRSGSAGVHEGFLMHLRGAGGHGLTIVVEDNVDLTGPIPLSDGEDVEVRGEYIYDARGGLIHYTHRDPRGRHEPGYVRAGGRTYSAQKFGTRAIQMSSSFSIL